jgi:hypothetical protein
MKTTFNRLLVLALWLVGLAVLATGLILEFRLPPGSRGGQGLRLLGWGRHDWGDLHSWLAYGLLALVAVHLAMHARWLWVVASQRRSWRLLAALALGVAMPLAALLWPVTPRQGAPRAHAATADSPQPQPLR